MKNDKRVVQEEDLLEFNSFMVSWRDFLPQPEPNDDSVVNYPLFDVSMPDEDDIFLFSGYMKPGVHNLVIYEPSSQKFFKMSNLVVFPRTQKIELVKLPQLDAKQIEDKEEKREAMEYHGPNYSFIKQFLYGNLLRDFNRHMSNLAFEYDTDAKYFKQVEFMDNIQKHYKTINKMWKVF